VPSAPEAGTRKAGRSGDCRIHAGDELDLVVKREKFSLRDGFEAECHRLRNICLVPALRLGIKAGSPICPVLLCRRIEPCHGGCGAHALGLIGDADAGTQLNDTPRIVRRKGFRYAPDVDPEPGPPARRVAASFQRLDHAHRPGSVRRQSQLHCHEFDRRRWWEVSVDSRALKPRHGRPHECWTPCWTPNCLLTSICLRGARKTQ
jgi:hypothetical protein